jgi:PAS domain S-box-containing protein
MPRPLRILILDDRPDDADLIVEQLREIGFAPEWDRVESEAAFVAKLDPGLDLILADYNLAQFSALRALEIVRERELDIPFIVVSGTSGEAAAVEAMRSGAHDYMSKGDLTSLRSAVERELRARAERKAAGAAQGRLRSIFDSALDAVVTMNDDGRITDWNPMAEKIFGWSRSDAIGRPMTDTIIPPRYREAHARGLRRFLATGEGPVLNQRLELEALHRDGHEFPIELSIASTRHGHGYAFSAFVRDIGERRRAEETVRRLAAIVESSIDPIVATGLDGMVLSWNGAAERLYGYAAAEIIGRSSSVLIPLDRADEGPATIETLKSGGRVDQVETIRQSKDGTLIDVSISFSALTDGHGTTIGVTGITRDIRVRKQGEHALQEQTHLYQALLKAQSDLGQIIILTDGTRPIYINEAFSDLTGFSSEELMRLNSLFDLVPPDQQNALPTNLVERLQGKKTRPFETVIVTKDGRRIDLEGTDMRFETGGRALVFTLARDITLRRQAQRALGHQALHDVLTGLPNRLLLVDRLVQALDAGNASGRGRGAIPSRWREYRDRRFSKGWRQLRGTPAPGRHRPRCCQADARGIRELCPRPGRTRREPAENDDRVAARHPRWRAFPALPAAG